MIVVPQDGAVGILNDFTDTIDYWLHAYVNNVVLSNATTILDFVEASFPGYAPLQIRNWFPANWDTDRAVAFADPLAWTRGAGHPPQTVYGIYVTAGQTGPLRYAESDPFGPVVMATAGQVLDYTPRLTLRTDPAQT